MRAVSCLFLALAAACGAPAEPQSTFNVEAAATYAEESCPAQASNLIAGQNIDAGDVSITNDDTNLYVQISTQDGWLLTETHIFAGTGAIPVNKKGTPVPGHFPYQNAFSPGVSSYTEVIPLAGLNIACGDSLKVAVHAVVVRPSGDGTEEQTAWGDGESFNTPRWSFFSTYASCCEPPPPPQCTASMEYWRDADPSTWPMDLSGWVFCWNPELGAVSPADIMDMAPDTFFVQLAQQYIAAFQNTHCYAHDCVKNQAMTLTNYLTNDCVIDESEQAQAQAFYAVLVAMNDGSYDGSQGQCLAQ